MDSLSIRMDAGVSLYDCKVYPFLASRLFVAFPMALLTSGVWVITAKYAGSLECIPRACVLDDITRDRSDMDTTGRMKHLLVKIIERVTYSTRIAAVPSECRADNVNGSCTVWHSNMPHTPEPEI